MTRSQIIEQLFTGKNFNDCLSKMEPEHLREDLRQEVALVVCEWPDEKVIGLWERKELEFYVVRVILNMIKSNSSPFYRKFRRITVDYSEHFNYSVLETCDTVYTSGLKKRSEDAKREDESTEDRQTREALEDLTLERINELYWYDAELLRMYMRLGNYRAIEKETGIPFASCYKNIQKSIATLRRQALGEPEPLFTKEEMKEMNTPQIKLAL